VFLAFHCKKLNIIEKDLKRLPHPFETSRSQTLYSATGGGGRTNSSHPATPPHGTTNTNASPATPLPPLPSPNSINQEARIGNLRELLYIYSQEHPNMGYRQGMHEIASFLLLVLELEEQSDFPHHPIITPILPFAYALLENTLEQLQIAYDASVDQSLQHMSLAILTKLYQNDPVLHRHLTTSPNIPPPPIYCTRWVRLLFSREVIGYENVLRLWDVLYEEQFKPRAAHQLEPQLPLVSNQSDYNNSSSSNGDENDESGARGTTKVTKPKTVELMHVLEITAASRILLLRNDLLLPDNNPLDLLMNMPPLADITPLANLLRQLLQQGDLDEPIPIPPSQQLYPPPATPPSKQQQQQQSSSQKSLSLKALRQTFGQKSESLKNKIINTTNEWKTNMQQQRESTNGMPGGGGIGGMNMSMSLGGGAGGVLRASSVSIDMAAAASAAIRNHQKVFQSVHQQEPQTVHFADPLLNMLNPQSQQQQQQQPKSQPMASRTPMQSYPNQSTMGASSAAGYSYSGVVPSSPSSDVVVAQMKQQQSQWAQDMQRHIWTVQQFLMLVEQQKSVVASAAATASAAASTKDGSSMAEVVHGLGNMVLGVPQDVWEAVADLDRIHHDLQNSAMGGEFW
jgi:hypothetical protein